MVYCATFHLLIRAKILEKRKPNKLSCVSLCHVSFHLRRLISNEKCQSGWMNYAPRQLPTLPHCLSSMYFSPKKKKNKKKSSYCDKPNTTQGHRECRTNLFFFFNHVQWKCNMFEQSLDLKNRVEQSRPDQYVSCPLASRMCSDAKSLNLAEQEFLRQIKCVGV